ncbi:hypothetical protein EKD16_20095 [Streptomonospora litoralis]|uniref:DUF6194 domain-containing protein n=2 Tax=Streptomonospora litoralis TaxID=2498135 RepID=A0A4V0ZK53_9ACTN|nr:DUF6194 family protein [Streptomonospora litoralis]QBI55782.1 hypothetical protein EKD16_20095 [Streptomonospora litoralis]
MEQILDTVRGFDGVLELAPTAGSEYPEIAWGDHFFYYAPDGQVPRREQPYATIVTKDYPDEPVSGLDDPGRWRLNVHVGKERSAELLGARPESAGEPVDYGAEDTLIPHPVYADLGWIAIVVPGARTSETAIGLLRQAHADAQRRYERRRAVPTAEDDDTAPRA